MFFRPEIIDAKWQSSLVDMLEETIQMSPIDCRRKLYNNIILSGGSTSIKGLVPRLDRELKALVLSRLEGIEQRTGKKPQPIEINMYGSPYKNYAVWNGGSMLACHVRNAYSRITSPTTTTSEQTTGKKVRPSPDTTQSSQSEVNQARLAKNDKICCERFEIINFLGC